jgi:GT2 family glycosyltransferase
MHLNAASPDLSVVVIGRNEGERLVACLASIAAADLAGLAGLAAEVIYVDSMSTDGSPARASQLGARVIVVSPQRPSAATGRNAGWRAARGRFVLFLDGDTLLEPEFLPAALAELQRSPRVAVVWGHRRERFPQQSVYNRVLDLDWVYPPGDSEFCGGDALFRRSTLIAAGGFDETLIAGEEPELCARLRAAGLRIRHIDQPMTRHDLAMTRWSQYWRRAERAGHAYAEIAARTRTNGAPLWQEDAQRNRVRGTVILVAPLAAAALIGTAGPAGALAAGALAAAVIARTAWRARWKCRDARTLVLYAIHSHLQQVPILWGQIAWHLSRRRGQTRGLIEYKAAIR